MRVLKGHGTENDFVVLPDLDGALDLTPQLVRALCDRHAGVGADGVLRVVRSENDPDAKEMAADAPFFMDYRNADGSLPEMCGNGIRVFVRYLQDVALVGTQAAIATRGGIKQVRATGSDAQLVVDMGSPVVLAERPSVTVGSEPSLSCQAAIEMPNPHVVVAVESVAALDVLDLSRAPVVDPSRDAGQNVEFVTRVGPRRLRMRVHERGVGETRSCGTGICAAVVAAAGTDGLGADAIPWQVDVPGGHCRVVWRPDGSVQLIGPAVIVAELELDERWLSAVPSAVPTEPER